MGKPRPFGAQMTNRARVRVSLAIEERDAYIKKLEEALASVKVEAGSESGTFSSIWEIAAQALTKKEAKR